MVRLLALGLCVFTACGTSTDVESQLTITQGLYGQLTQRCDQPDCVGAPRVGTPVAFFTSNPLVNPPPSPMLETTSKANGFFEFALDSGARGYLALGKPDTTRGTVWFTATSVLIPRGLGRVDWRATAQNEGQWTDVR